VVAVEIEHARPSAYPHGLASVDRDHGRGESDVGASPFVRRAIRDAIYGEAFRQRVAGMGIGEVVSAPSSPWQNRYAERLIGSIRRDCLDHVVVLGEQHLRRVLAAYITYYHGSRTHLSLAKDAPTPDAYRGPPRVT
jgi:transposase InsO family protein